MKQKHDSDLSVRRALATGNVKMNLYNQTMSNSEKELNAIWAIFGVLSDGQWHRNMALKEKTKLGSSTLPNHLNKMENLEIIERKEAVENGKYAVFFKATPALREFIVASFTTWEYAKQLELELYETKDPIKALEYVHFDSQLQFARILEQIQQNKNITVEEINFLEEYFLWNNYKVLTSRIVEASRKIIDELNITSLVKHQPIQTEGYRKILKARQKTQDVPLKDAARRLS